MIALVGSDGAGKSTVGRELRQVAALQARCPQLLHGLGRRRHPCPRPGCGEASGRWLADQRPQGEKPRQQRWQSRSRPRGISWQDSGTLSTLIMRHKIAPVARRAPPCRRAAAWCWPIVIRRRRFSGISDGPKIQGPRGFAWAARQANLATMTEARELGPDLVLSSRSRRKWRTRGNPITIQASSPRRSPIIDALEFPQCTVIDIDATRPLDEVLLAAKRAIWTQLKPRAA